MGSGKWVLWLPVSQSPLQNTTRAFLATFASVISISLTFNITATFLNRDGSRKQLSEVQCIRHAAWPRHCLLRILPVVYRLHALPRPRLQHAVCEEYCPPAVGSFDSSAKLEHRPRLACTEEKLDQRSGAGSEFNRYQWLRIQWLATAGRHPIWHVQLVQHAPCEVARISKS